LSGPIDLTEVDFAEIKQNLIDYLKSTEKFTDFDFDGSNLSVILNLLAYQSQLTAYSTNMIANESFLTSATLRDNVVMNARMLGYVPTSARAAQSMASFDFKLDKDDYPNGFPQYLEIQPGMIFSSSNGLNNFIFNIIDTQVSSVSNAGICRFDGVRIHEGILLSHTFVVDESDWSQRFMLQNEAIDTSTIRVEVQEDPSKEVNHNYKEAKNLVKLTQESRVYWLEEGENKYYELTFGDGLFGKKLENGAKIFCKYLITNGNLANGIQGENNYTFVARVIDSYGTVVTTRPIITAIEPAEGGAELEDVSSVKFHAPKSYAAQSRAVTEDDYETIIRDIFPAVQDIYVFGGETLPLPEYGRVYVVVKPTTGDALSTLTKHYIKKSLDPYRIASLDIVLVDPEVVNVEIISNVFYDEKQTNKDSAAIVAAVKDTLKGYGESNSVSKFGGAVRYSQIVSSIDDSDLSITRNNTSLRMRKDVEFLVDQPASYEICYLNEIKPDCDGPVIMTNGFKLRIDDVIDDRLFYFEDDGVGNIRTYYYNSINEKIIHDKEFGTINYVEGEIKLGYQKPITFTEVQASDRFLKVTAIPKNQDIIATQSLFINLDIANSSIVAVIENKVNNQ